MDEKALDRFHGFIADYLREKDDLSIQEVRSVEEVTRTGGYCETCYYEELVLEIYYIDLDGNNRTYDYYGSLAEFFNVETRDSSYR